jgi:hypothetical protein
LFSTLAANLLLAPLVQCIHICLRFMDAFGFSNDVKMSTLV